MKDFIKSYITVSRLITGFAIIVLILGGAFFYNNSNNRNIKEQKEYLESIKLSEKEIGENISYLIAEILKPNFELITSSYKQIQKVDFNNISKIKEFLVNRSAGFTYADGFYFGSQLDGKFVSAQNPNLPKGYDPRNRGWYKLAIKDNKIHITKPYVDASTKKLCITFSKAIYKSGKVMGVIGVDVFVDSVTKLLKGIESSQNANLYIIDNDGLINFSKDRTEIGKNIATVFHTTTDIINGKTNKDSNNSKKEYAKYISIVDKTGKQNEMYLTSIPGYDWKTIVFINPYNIKNVNQDKFNKSTPFIPVLIFLLLILVVIIIQNYLNRRQLLHNLNHDFLTKLPNRNSFEKTIRRTIPKCKNGTKALLILMDVDNFKFFNDTIGNINADKIIFSLSQLIKKNANRNSFVCRVGGDEFAVIIRNISYEKARIISEEYRKLVNESPVFVGDNFYDLTVSVGSILFDDSFSLEKVLSYADTSLSKAKDQGKNRVVFSNSELDINSIELLALDEINKTIVIIKDAIRDNRFTLYFQPIIKIGSSKISHYEALVRLVGKNGEIYLPSMFIPVAEKFGFITAIDKWVFNTALEILKVYKDITIFINLSGISLADNMLLEYFENKILESGFITDNLRLGFEITETAATKNFEQAERWIKKFKELGCLISIDDFGVGYTSFSYLNSLPVDFVKIDGSFIKNIDTNANHKAIVQAIHTVVKTLGKETIAEYVESAAIMDTLSELGIQYGQGYYIGKPLPQKESLNRYKI